MRILGLDIGEKRVGVAVSDENMKVAQPLTTIERRDDDKTISEIAESARRLDASVVVYGNPVNLAGRNGKQTELVKSFAERLGQVVRLPVIAQDERFSTAEAEKTLIAQGLKRKKRRQVVDKVAAAVILQAYLDGRCG